MLQDYSIAKCTRKCAIRGEALQPGEAFYSVIAPKGDDLTRIDISATAWTGAKDDAIGWWKCRMPEAGPRKLRPAPTGVLLDLLSDLLERPGKEMLTFFLALLLVRRRILTDEQPAESPADPSARQLWALICPADGRQWNVPVCEPTIEELPLLEEELNGLLFTEE